MLLDTIKNNHIFIGDYSDYNFIKVFVIPTEPTFDYTEYNYMITYGKFIKMGGTIDTDKTTLDEVKKAINNYLKK